MGERTTTSQLVHQTHYRVLQTSLGTICSNFFTWCPGISEDLTSGKRWYTALFIGLDRSNNLKDSISSRRNFFISNDTLSDIMNFVIDDDISNIALAIGILSALFALIMIYLLEDSFIDSICILVPVYLGYTISMTVYGILATTINTMLICYYRYPNEFAMYQPELFVRISEAIRLYPAISGRNDAITPSTELV
jgi:hypothetical protein